MTTRAHFVLGAILLSAAATLHAQEPPCGVSTVKESAPLVYPPIARAAHVTGLVIVRASFSEDGRVEAAEMWRGPKLLENAAISFVKGLQANAYGGSRTCLLSITFRMLEDIPEDFHGDQLAFVVKREQDITLHYTVVGWTVPLVTMSDPRVKVIHRRFLGIF